MKLRTLALFAMVSVTALFAACGGGESDPEPEEEIVTKRIGAAGGTLVLESADGTSFELRVPAAALSGEQEISIRRLPAAEWPPEAETNPPIGGAIFELLPEGTMFSVPATTLTRFSQAPATLGSAESQTLPSHMSRSSAGTMKRHPTTIHSRTDGSAVMIGRTTHFSAHWASTQTDEGEFGVNLSWPASPFGVETTIFPTEFSVWSSSEASPLVAVDIGVFVVAPAADLPVIGSGYYELQEPAFGSEIEQELLSYLADLEDTRSIDSEGGVYTASTWFSDPDMGIGTTYPVGEPLLLEPEIYGPCFTCMAVGTGTGFVVVRSFVSDGAGGTVPLTYVDELSFECS
jgi:hypothetical protein